MTEFTVHLANRPGMLAILAERLAEAGINIEALAAFGSGPDGTVRLIVDNAELARTVLYRTDLHFEERAVITTVLPHEPGALAAMARRLADARVNIDAMYLLRSSAECMEFAVAVDDEQAALAG